MLYKRDTVLIYCFSVSQSMRRISLSKSWQRINEWTQEQRQPQCRHSNCELGDISDVVFRISRTSLEDREHALQIHSVTRNCHYREQDHSLRHRATIISKQQTTTKNNISKSLLFASEALPAFTRDPPSLSDPFRNQISQRHH